MKKSAFEFPRSIDPSLIEVGDTIKVTLPKSRGLETSVTGTVDHRADHGKTRYLYTSEGATILAWEPHTDRRVHVLLLHRPEAKQTPLSIFASDELKEVNERLAS